MDASERIEAISADLREEPERLAPPTTLEAVMQRHGIPGVGLAVVAGEEIDWAGGFGVRDAESGEPVTAETLFQAGSISKPVAALCALRLVAEGRLELDEDVNGCLTSWRIPSNGAWQPRVTLRQLLSHTAGLTVHGFPGYPADEPAPGLVEVLDGRGNTPPVRVRTLPGLQFSYSGGGYCVLQQLLIDVTGEPFPELALRLVLEPLGMEASTYEQPLPDARAANASSGHRTAGKPVAGRWHVYPEMAAAGLWTTAADLARFVLAIQRSHAGSDGGILPAELTRELLTPQASNAGIGLGLFVEGEGTAKLFRHGGDDQGFVAWLTGYLERGDGAVVMTNSDAGMWAIELLLGAVAREYDWPDDEGRDPLFTAVSEAEAEACAGAFVSEDGDGFFFEREGTHLVLSVEGQAPLDLRAASATRWHASALRLSVHFDLAPSGRALHARLHQDAEYVQDVRLTRIA